MGVAPLPPPVVFGRNCGTRDRLMFLIETEQTKCS